MKCINRSNKIIIVFSRTLILFSIILASISICRGDDVAGTFRDYNCHIIQLCDSKDGQVINQAQSVVHGLDLDLEINSYYKLSSNFLNCSALSGMGKNIKNKEIKANFQSFTVLNGQCYFKYRNVYYAPKDYCISSLHKNSSLDEANEATVLVCESTFVINKCCDLGQLFATQVSSQGGECRNKESLSNSSINLINNLYLPHAENSLTLLSFQVSPFHSAVKIAELANSSKIVNQPGSFQVQESAVYCNRPVGVFLRGKLFEMTENYCVDVLYTNSASNAEAENQNIILFYDAGPETAAQNMATIIGILWISGVPLAFLSAVGNLAILQRNVAGLTLSTYFLSIGFVDIFASIIIFSFKTNSRDDQLIPDCTLLDFIQKFAYSSTTFWLAIVNFDLWWNFRRLKSSLHSFKEDLVRFMYYCIFGIGGSGFHVLIAWFVGQYFERRDFEEGNIHGYCVLYSLPSLIAFSCVTLLLVLLNSCFFVVTWRNIRLYQECAKGLQKNCKAMNSSFRLYTKLFLMAGPNRLVRIIILFAHFNYTFLSPFGVFLEFLFSLPDFVLFFLVFCHRNFYTKLSRAFPYFQGKLKLKCVQVVIFVIPLVIATIMALYVR